MKVEKHFNKQFALLPDSPRIQPHYSHPSLCLAFQNHETKSILTVAFNCNADELPEMTLLWATYSELTDVRFPGYYMAKCVYTQVRYAIRFPRLSDKVANLPLISRLFSARHESTIKVLANKKNYKAHLAHISSVKVYFVREGSGPYRVYLTRNIVYIGGSRMRLKDIPPSWFCFQEQENLWEELIGKTCEL